MRKDEVRIKEQTINELEKEMRRCIKDLEVSETERKRMEHDLAERVKELQVFYGISSIAEKSHITLEKLYQEVADLLPDAWQYPEITCARVIINNKRFETENWRETEWKQSSDIKVHGVKAGAIEICYLEERPLSGEDPFLIEEKRLIDAAAERLGKITERIWAEEALQKSEKNLRSLLNSIEDLVFIVAKNGTFKGYYQPLDRQDLYVRPSEFLGKHFRDVLPLDVAKLLQSAMKRVETSDEVQKFDYMLEMKGKNSWYDARVSPIRDESGAVSDFVVVARNITERKQMEEVQMEHAAAMARAEEVLKSRQRIITMQESLRRDIAQQLHGTVQSRLIILMHRLTDLERSCLSEEMAAEVADLRQEVKELLDDHIRPIGHRLFPHILRRGLVPALQSLVDQFETVLSIDVELSEELKRQEKINPRFITEQVRLALYRIAEEALVNATKHTKASRITVKLELSSEGWLRLTVQDDGCGFDMKSASTGLGMLMMQDYAEVVGGRCVINTSPGNGTEVTVAIPIVEPGAGYPERA